MSISDPSAFHHRGQYGSVDEAARDNENMSLLQLGALDSSEDLSSKETNRSGWVGAAFNLTSSIIGAGCIGLGGAIAHSGGLVSLLALTGVAILSKYSFDLVIDLAVESGEARPSYESLGILTYGARGKFVVILSKGLYSFGCLVAYIVIVKDNFACAIAHLLHGENSDNPLSPRQSILTNQYFVTVFFCTTVMLPLCMMRDVSPLERFSALKISVLMLIVVIVMYLFFVSEKIQPTGSFADHWLVIHAGVFESLGTFVFTFVAQHSIHLVYQSMKRSEQKNIHKATTLGTVLSTTISMVLGFFVYMTFWENTSSSMFEQYPPSNAVDLCRILLCMSMLLTYPFPFFTVRELFVLFFVSDNPHRRSLLLPGDDRQLQPKYHAALTVVIWSTTVLLALAASSLGVVLNVTGSATGSVISYILPALFSYKLRGHTIVGSVLFLLGGSVGLIGTYYSILAL